MGFIEFIKKLFFGEDKVEDKSTVKKYVCKNGRIVYPVRCRKCNRLTNTTDKETALRKLYVCSKCVPRKKKE